MYKVTWTTFYGDEGTDLEHYYGDIYKYIKTRDGYEIATHWRYSARYSAGILGDVKATEKYYNTPESEYGWWTNFFVNDTTPIEYYWNIHRPRLLKILCMPVGRIVGVDRIETACKIAQTGWNQSDFAILSRSDNFPDALSGGPLSEFYCPILLTAPTQINVNTLQKLQKLQTKRVIILGGTPAVSQAVEDKLKQQGFEVERIAGPDRYSTSAEIAKELKEKGVNKVIITTGTNFPDALAATPYAAKQNAVVLLTDPKNLPNPIKDAINFLGVKDVTILGSTAAVSQNVENQLKAMGLSVSRIAGADRYETAVKIAEKMSSSKLIIATGENFPDALAGGSL